ncbi:FliA/WhiG family RNA polymerase sigma factor [Burkholderia sp. Ac-20379]|uniref:FliA/WhiG family RNA polymerase sigma factor n=1 Tax=Burkholderia sp. Ac-20379 TaxID=2703900 RepID=UPI00197D07F2|nr:FliA/WhiG family RNA polymerase sigma factor [Burkholderia sp. Ac-20379]MBN3728758.1 FliA/WhiG family RNA polymerase sigma factor [Burkholderia sp. Ac-20379]
MNVSTSLEYRSVQRADSLQRRDDEQRWLLRHTPLVTRIARRMSLHAGGTMEREDLEQIGLIGLLEALRRYGEPDGDFEHFAAVRVRGAMLDELRRQDWRPRGARQGAHRLRAGERALRASLGRDPTDAELAEALDADADTIARWQRDDCADAFLSFDELFEQQGDAFAHEGAEAQVQNRIDLTHALLALDPREQRVVQLHYEFELGLAEIAAVLDLTAARVCQINKAALRKMRTHLTPR